MYTFEYYNIYISSLSSIAYWCVANHVNRFIVLGTLLQATLKIQITHITFFFSSRKQKREIITAEGGYIYLLDYHTNTIKNVVLKVFQVLVLVV